MTVCIHTPGLFPEPPVPALIIVQDFAVSHLLERSSCLSVTTWSSNHGAREPVAPPRCIIEVSLVSPVEAARSIVRSAEGLNTQTAGPCFAGAWTRAWPCVCGLPRWWAREVSLRRSRTTLSSLPVFTERDAPRDASVCTSLASPLFSSTPRYEHVVGRRQPRCCVTSQMVKPASVEPERRAAGH